MEQKNYKTAGRKQKGKVKTLATAVILSSHSNPQESKPTTVKGEHIKFKTH